MLWDLRQGHVAPTVEVFPPSAAGDQGTGVRLGLEEAVDHGRHVRERGRACCSSRASRNTPNSPPSASSNFTNIASLPVPALNGRTWPLTWRYRASSRDQLVHALLLRSVLWALGHVSVHPRE